MAKYTIEDSTLVAIGDAIRGKNGQTEPMTPTEMATAISNINTGDFDTGYAAGVEDSEAGMAKFIARTESVCSNDQLTSIGAYAFHNYAALKTVDCPNVTSINKNAFSQCSGLTRLEFPKLTSTGTDVFTYCSNLTYVDLGQLAEVQSWTFYYCTKLTAVILRRTNGICTLRTTNAFSSTPIESGTGYIYVPAALIESYKVATNWVDFADQFRAIEDYPEICGG